MNRHYIYNINIYYMLLKYIYPLFLREKKS